MFSGGVLRRSGDCGVQSPQTGKDHHPLPHYTMFMLKIQQLLREKLVNIRQNLQNNWIPGEMPVIWKLYPVYQKKILKYDDNLPFFSPVFLKLLGKRKKRTLLKKPSGSGFSTENPYTSKKSRPNTGEYNSRNLDIFTKRLPGERAPLSGRLLTLPLLFFKIFQDILFWQIAIASCNSFDK